MQPTIPNQKAISQEQLEMLTVNTIRFLSVDAVQKAESGHPGLPMGAAPMAYALWQGFLRHSPHQPAWFDRDRFVLSAGHGSMLLYSLLHLTGYDLPMEQIRQFRQWGSITPGHPERGLTPGVETTTGPLGQGFANGVGMAIAEAALAARFNRPDFPLIRHYTYGIVSDGDLMEGVAMEAASLAGHLNLGRLIYLYDDNGITLAASTRLTLTEDISQRFTAMGWQVQAVKDGNDLAEIRQAIDAARRDESRPSLIRVRTRIGFGSPHKENSFAAHGSPLGVEEVRLSKDRLGWPQEPAFHVPDEVREHMGQAVIRGDHLVEEWQRMLSDYCYAYPAEGAELKRRIRGELPAEWAADIPAFPPDAKGISSRAAGGKVLAAISSRLPELMGGSADLNPSTLTILPDSGDFQAPNRAGGDMQGSLGEWSYGGRNLHFGVREHGMASICNGMAAHGGILPFDATFLTFADYMRPAIRLAALMGLAVIHVFTHDSIAVGEDGPTHQPVEQLASLRAIPHLLVIRPGDANETAAAWQAAVECRRPVALVFSRQNLPTLDRQFYAPAEGLRRGAYILADPPDGPPELILMASGSEVGLIAVAGEMLQQSGVAVRLVSMPCWELFMEQPQIYRDTVLPPTITCRLAVEAGVSQGWHQFVGCAGEVVGVDRFGASAPGPEVMRSYGFHGDNVFRRAMDLLGRG